ncbi:hypothetical protein CLIB1423_07S06304 [[Candida] railenensis]|uniref:Uncharacterized protein n=1 Tax=[Candida] railenensis TaxID=45579 RepID=A0A9P0QNY5_9ASCO|nr:hypothetical protein CLIB1423_07S06304 [[Candida] railenensis]
MYVTLKNILKNISDIVIVEGENMSSHLKSFEADDSFTRSSAKRVKERMFSDEDDSDNDLDFDDTNLETPRGFKPSRDPTTNSNDSSFVPKGQYKTQSRTVKVPLKDDSNAIAQKRSASTPISKYRSRNGTPLRQPPITSKAHELDEEEHEEATIIKNGKLISDENRYSPNLSKLKSPRKSPIRNVNVPSNVISPPPNFKLTPVDFSFLSRSNGKNSNGKGDDSPQTNGKDIEFDPSDDDEVDKVEEQVERVEVENIQTHDKSNGSPIDRSKKFKVQPKFTLESNSMLETPQQPSNIPSSSPSPDPNDVSRADILERINSTIQSIKERELKELKSSSPIKRSSLLGRGSPQAPYSNRHSQPIGSNEDFNFNGRDDIREVEELIALDDDTDDNDNILQEIDSYLPTSPAQMSTNTRNTLSVSNMETDSPKLSKFPGGYERSMLAENLIIRPETDTTPFSTTTGSTTSARTSKDEWSTAKWLKLRKILALKKLTSFEIINSSIIQESLAVSKKDLANRVHFLMELDRHKELARERKLKKVGRRTNAKSGNIKVQPKNLTSRRKKLL